MAPSTDSHQVPALSHRPRRRLGEGSDSDLLIHPQTTHKRPTHYPQTRKIPKAAKAPKRVLSVPCHVHRNTPEPQLPATSGNPHHDKQLPTCLIACLTTV
eukprot:scaffold8252_cov239-Pinguiococcus_pyrenoidosus.AAC.2